MGQSYAMDVESRLPEKVIWSFTTPTKVQPEPILNTSVSQDSSPVSVVDLFPTRSNKVQPIIIDGILIGRGSPADSVASERDSQQEAKREEIRHVRTLFGSDERKVHPLEIGEADIENQKSPKAVVDDEEEKIDDKASVHSVDEEDTPEAIAKRDAILKDWNANLNDVFRRDMNHYDWAFLIIPLVLTGVIAQNEILGEYRLWYDSIVGTYGLTVPGYEYLYMTLGNLPLINLIEKIAQTNAYVSLPPYLLSRISSLCDYVGYSFTGRSLKTKIGFGLTALGLIGVTVAAVNAGAVPALTLYSADIKFSNTAVYAETLPPYLFSFYTADSFLINSLFRDNVYKYLFVDRKDDTVTKILRNALIKKPRTVKAWLASMTDDELIEFDKTMKERSKTFSGEYTAIEEVKYLNKSVAQDKGENRRYSVRTRNKQAESHFNVGTLLRNNWPALLGLGLAAGGAYLTCNGSQHSFESAMQTKISTHLGWPHFDFSNLGVYTYQQFSIARYGAWQDITENVVVFNNGTGGIDWCEQCLNSADYTTGNLTIGGSFIFTDCPGVTYLEPFTSNPGDLGYTYDQCWGLFNFIDSSDAYDAGTTDDYYAAPPLNPLTLSPSEQAIAMIAAIVYAGVNAVLAAPAISDAIGRISDSFSNAPENILPAKRNKVWNAFTLAVSGIESLVHSTFIATAAWYYLQKTSISESWLWTVVALTWVSVAANFFKGYDDAYSRMLTATAKGFKLGKNVAARTLEHINSYSFVNSITKPTYEYSTDVSSYILNTSYAQKMAENPYVSYVTRSVQTMQKSVEASIICDEWIDRLIRIENTIKNAPKDVLEVMNAELIS